MDWLTQLLSTLGPGAANAGAPGIPGAGTFDDRFAPAAALPPAQPIAQLPAYSNAILGPNPMNVGPSLGESIGGTGGPGGQPLDLSTQGPGMGAGQSTGSKLLQALRGVKAPDAPVAQRVATPHAPQQRPIGGGNDLVQLLIGLGLGPKDVVPGFRIAGR